jgi:hypothetical protein
MKLLFSSPDARGLGLIRTALDEAGITYEIRNETMPYPLAAFDPEIWILEDADFSKASELRDRVTRLPTVSQTSWTCPGCGERLEGQFGSCWKCGRSRDDIPPVRL